MNDGDDDDIYVFLWDVNVINSNIPSPREQKMMHMASQVQKIHKHYVLCLDYNNNSTTGLTTVVVLLILYGQHLICVVLLYQ